VQHAAFGHDGINQCRRRHIEHRIEGADAFGHGALAAVAEQFRRVAFLDLDIGPAGGGHIDRGPRRHDHQLQPEMPRHDGELAGADLVGDIAVGGDAVGADDHPMHLTGAHQVRGGGIGDEGGVNAVLLQLPHRQARALQPGPGFSGEHPRDLLLRDAGADYTQRSAETSGGQRTGIAVGQHATAWFDQCGTEFAHVTVGGQVFGFDGLGFRQ
jgi:hypothetical protein